MCQDDSLDKGRGSEAVEGFARLTNFNYKKTLPPNGRESLLFSTAPPLRGKSGSI
ncbi:hypothetical protein KKH82_05790 [Patescibacteria group bacterium]|nr:hypothetical protein [Patescibacteria group bacterium]